MEEPQVIQVTPDVVFQQDRAAIDIQIATAKQYPRNISKATENAIAIVVMDKETAATCTYAVPRGGKSITGPSVHLAKIILQQWGNMRVQAKVIDVSEKTVTSQATAFDLENNIAVQVEVKRSIWGRTGRYTDDMIAVTGNAGNSIAMRNAIYAVIPKSVIDKVYKEALKTITGDLSSESKLKAARKQVFDGFKETYGVTEEEVLRVIGKAALKFVTAEDIVVLTGIAQAIKDGDTTVEDAFRSKKKEEMKKAEEKERDRIINFINAAANVAQLEAEVWKVVKDLDPMHELKVKYFSKKEILEHPEMIKEDGSLSL